MKKLIILAVAFMFLGAGCTHIISEKSLAMADPRIEFTQLRDNPDKYFGKFVIVGGSIAGVTRSPDGVRVEVVQYPLDSMELPDPTSDSKGRFMVALPPEQAAIQLKPGVLVTMAGEVVGKTVKPLEGRDYTYPVIAIKEIHIITRPPAGYYRGY
jgi:outer membrane lipoprotein